MNHPSQPFIEFEIRIHPQIFMDYLCSRRGLWHDVGLTAMTLLIVMLSTAYQLAMPESFPSIPCFSAAWGIAFLSTRRSPFISFLCAFFSGILLDAACFHPLGPSSFILCAVAAVCSWMNSKIAYQSFFLLNTLFLSLTSTALFVFPKIFFCRPLSKLENDIALLPRHLLGGCLLSIPVCMTFFAILDILEMTLFDASFSASREN